MKVCHVRYNSTLRGKLNLLKMKQSDVNPFYERPAWMTRCALFCDKKFATVANSCGFVSMFSRFTVDPGGCIDSLTAFLVEKVLTTTPSTLYRSICVVVPAGQEQLPVMPMSRPSGFNAVHRAPAEQEKRSLPTGSDFHFSAFVLRGRVISVLALSLAPITVHFEKNVLTSLRVQLERSC